MILLEKEFRDIIRSDRTAEKAAKFIHRYVGVIIHVLIGLILVAFLNKKN